VSAPSPPFTRNDKCKKGCARAESAYQEGGESGKSFGGGCAEKDAAPIVRNQSKVVSAGGVSSRYESRAKGKPGRGSGILCIGWHGPSNDQNAERGNADMEDFLHVTFLAGTASSRVYTYSTALALSKILRFYQERGFESSGFCLRRAIPRKRNRAG
jgi:hypothetical protein